MIGLDELFDLNDSDSEEVPPVAAPVPAATDAAGEAHAATAGNDAVDSAAEDGDADDAMVGDTDDAMVLDVRIRRWHNEVMASKTASAPHPSAT